MYPGDFFTELKRRNVVRTAGLYLVGAWLLTQVAVLCFRCSAHPGAFSLLIINWKGIE
jgi:hypothetical protein